MGKRRQGDGVTRRQALALGAAAAGAAALDLESPAAAAARSEDSAGAGRARERSFDEGTAVASRNGRRQAVRASPPSAHRPPSASSRT
ncbi:hypothetical protein [Streptomyces sp. NPDC054834]